MPSPRAYKLDVSDTVSGRYDFEKWLKTKMPMLVLQFPIFVSKVIFDCHSDGYNFQFDCPALTGHESEILTRLDMHVLATMSLNLVKHKPKKLFSTTENGFGFGNLVNALEGYVGLHCSLLKTCKQCFWWIYMPRRARKEFYGTENCFLFSIKPTLWILSPRITSSMNIIFNICVQRTCSRRCTVLGLGAISNIPAFLFLVTLKQIACRAQASSTKFIRDNESDGQYFTRPPLKYLGTVGRRRK